MTLYIEDYEFVLGELQSTFEFSEEHAKDAIQRLSETPLVFVDLVVFLKTKKHSSLKVQEHDIEDLMLNYGLSDIGAYLMLSELVADPKRGQMYLEIIKEEGHRVAEYNPDGSIKKITFRSDAASSSTGPPLCPKCGKRATWVEQYKRWYCYECKEYL